MPTFKPTTLAIGEEGTTSTYGEEDATSDSIGEEDPSTTDAIGEEGPYYPETQTPLMDNPFGAY
jgi:hypothetical protein